MMIDWRDRDNQAIIHEIMDAVLEAQNLGAILDMLMPFQVYAILANAGLFPKFERGDNGEEWITCKLPDGITYKRRW